MEISITWNICRVCLQEEIKNEKDQKHHSIFVEKLAKSIFSIAGVTMKENDGLPGKICPKCLKILKYAIYFRKTCRESDTNLQSVIQRTKSASSLFKKERRKDILNDSQSADDPLFYEIDYDDDTEAGHIDCGEEEEQKSEGNDRIHKRKGNHTELQRQKSVKSQGEEHNDLSGTLTVKYEDEKNKTDDLLSHDETEGSEMGEVLENPEINSSSHEDEEPPDQLVHEEHLDHSLESNRNSSNVEPHNLHTSYTKYASSAHNLVSIEESELTDDDPEMSHMQEESESTNLKAHSDGLYYILNNIKVDDHSQQQEQDDANEGNDNVADFVPIDEDGDMQQHIVEAHEDDMDENRTQVTSTVTKEEIDYDDACSNLSQNTQDVDAEEFIVDEYIIDDCSMQRSNSLLHSKISLNVKNKYLKAPTISRSSNGSTQATSSLQHLVCELCGNNFTNRQLMNIHMKIHRQEKKHECELCFKRFISACNLQAHMRIHTGEKPYECKFCSRRFSDRSTHIRHERIHTNEKPFTCENCGKAFALATTLQAHLKVHTGERPYRCEPCAKSFKLPHQLKAHQNTSLHKIVAEQFDHEYINS